MENIYRRSRFFATRKRRQHQKESDSDHINRSAVDFDCNGSANSVKTNGHSNVANARVKHKSNNGDQAKQEQDQQNQDQNQSGKSRGNDESTGNKIKKRAVSKQASSASIMTTTSNTTNNSSSGMYDCLTPMTRSRLNTLAQIGEDWLYLALLGIIMALLSLSMDSVITIFLGTRIWLSEEASEQNLLLQYLAWCITPILLVTFSTGFVHLCSPTAIGSGIPEMKTILRGVVLNEYLTFRTLIAKIVGLTFTLGSGLPLGKEGPSVHMASIVATLLSKLVASFQGIYENESRTSEMLSAACAVGVAATFYAPIGGVLFSIEVTTVYFAVRNYWRGFFAACCGATIWRLLGFYIKNDESISAIFKTSFSTEYPFDPVELVVFSFIGATCGLAGAAYIKFHREIVQFFRRHKRISGFLQQNRFVYPTLVTLIITTSSFPPFLGKYTAATLSTHTTIEHLFSNRTWSQGSQDLISKRILEQWTTEDTSFYLHLILYILMLFWTSALASTIPTPSGVFIPVVKMGAAYGRLIGELMASAYPEGIKYSHPGAIVPGSYAVVGAAAFSGAVTHTVSTSVILFEMTGQIVHIIPVILGVLISNAVCQSLQPSIYDSIIEIKKLPYLPPIASSNSISHRILVKDFMNTDIPFVWKERYTYADLKALLSTHRKIISFPLVESPLTMKLLGSVARPDLLKLLYIHLGRERRLQEVCRRNSDTLTPTLNRISTISGHLGVGERQLSNMSDMSTRSIEVSIERAPRPAAAAAASIASQPPIDGGGGGGGANSNSAPDDDDGDGGIEFKRLNVFKRDSNSSSTGGDNEIATIISQQQQISERLQANNFYSSPSPQSPPQLDHAVVNPFCSINSTSADLEERQYADRNCNNNNISSSTDSADCDATRLIIDTSKIAHNYGATASERQLIANSLDQTVQQQQQQAAAAAAAMVPNLESNSTPAVSQSQSLQQSQPVNATKNQDKNENKNQNQLMGEEQLLNECQKDVLAHEEEEYKQFNSVAKMINHYDRGSSMDEDHLDKSIQDIEGHLAKVVTESALDTVVVISHESLAAAADRSLGSPNAENGGQHQFNASARPQDNVSSLTNEANTSCSSRSSNSSGGSGGGDGEGGGEASFKVSDSQISIFKPQTSVANSGTMTTPTQTPANKLMELKHTPSYTNVPLSSPSLSSRPTKSILKTSSFSNNMSKRMMTPSQSFNSSLASYDSKILGYSSQLSNIKFTVAPEQTRTGSYMLGCADVYNQQQQQDKPVQTRQRRKVRLPRLRVVDMTPEEQEQWEKEQLNAYIDITKCQIDEAPFQLVEQTSLYRVHTLFSMLGLNHAYVTSFGRLVGIVALKDIRYAIEKMLQEK